MPQFDPVLGVFAPEIPWIPTVAHIIRRAAIFDALGGSPPGRVLEIGCGAGAFLYDLRSKGYDGKGVDTSETALAVARRLHGGGRGEVRIDGAPGDDDVAGYDYVMAFEVLEHIEDDVRAIRDWQRYLKPSGKMIVSVPAHRRMWGASDEWAGHVRRYDLADLHASFGAAGLRIERSCCYGFPVMNLLAPLSNFICRRKSARRRRRGAAVDAASATSISGTDRVFESKIFGIYSNALAKAVFRLIFAIQRRFYGTPSGAGYIVTASRA